jgi:predicted amidophosphoribosyltransferase
MPIGCKGKCHRYATIRRYRDGNKSCSVCDIFIKWAGHFCPCCHRALRQKGKYSGKKIVRERKEQMENELIVKYDG